MEKNRLELEQQGFKTYENDAICVFWNPKMCAHAGKCVLGNGKVFEVGRRPWIDLSQAPAEEIAAIIDRCPSKALQYELKKNDTMKQSSIISVVIIAFVMLTLFNIAVFAPTLHRQVPFNSWVWNHAHSPFGRVRYYMSESLIEELNQTQPTYQEAYELLGEDFWDTFDGGCHKEKCINRELYYFLKSDAIIGWDHYYLSIEFDEQGNYKQAYITHED